MLGLTWFHAVLIALTGPILGYRWDLNLEALLRDGTVLHTVGEGLIVAVFAVLGGWKSRSRTFKATAIGFGLMTSSAILVHLSGGYIEFHFHFFVMLTFLALLQDWIPYGLAILFVAIHHGVFGVLWPEGVYNHTAAFNAPWTWAGIHAFFVLWASAGNIVAWRFNEGAFGETRRHLERIQAVRDLGRAMSSTLELQPMLNLLLEKIELSFPDSALIVRLVNEASTELEVAAWRNVTQEELRHAVQWNAPGLSGVALKSGQRLMNEDVPGSSHSPSPEILRRYGLRSYLGVPLITKDRALGTLSIFSKKRRVFSAEEIEFVSMLAGHAGVAIQNAQFHTKLVKLASDLAKSNDKLKERAGELASLNTVAIEAGRTLDVQEILEIALDKALALTNRERGYIRLKDPVTGDLTLAAHRGLPEDYIQTLLEGRTPGGKSDQVFQSGQSLIVNDPSASHLRKASRFGVYATAWIPMKARGKVVGIMNVSTTRSVPFIPREVNLLEAIASVTGNAWENARLFQEAEARATEISALYDVSTIVNRSLELEPVLQEVLRKIINVFSFDATRVYLFDQKSGEIRLHTDLDNRPEPLVPVRAYHPGEGNVGKTFQSGVPVIFPNVNEDPQHETNSLSRAMQSSGYNFFAAFPIRSQLKPLGVLTCIGRAPRYLTAVEIRLLNLMADQIGITVDHIRLYEETKQQASELEKTNTELRRREEVQSLLKELSLDITTLDIDQLFKKLTEKAREILRVDTSDVKLMEGGTQRLIGVSGIDPESLRSSSLLRPGGATRWIEENRRPLVIPDVTQSREVQIGETTRRIGIRGYLRVPLFSRDGEVLGSIRALTYQPRNFSREEVDLLQQMANGAALALENARLLDAIKKQTMELRRSNKVKDEFLSVISHELRTPLAAVMGYAAILHDGGLGKLQSKQAKALYVIENQTKGLLEMINSILEATKIEAGAAAVQNRGTDLRALLEDIRSIYDFSPKKELSFIWDYDGDLPQIETDPGKLKYALQNLINNAIKFTPKGNVAVSARYLPGTQRVEFQVRDTGVGIPREMQSVIFERFRQVDSSETRLYGGVGLGLYIAKSFTEMLGGTLAVSSQVGQGSVFTLVLPLGDVSGDENLGVEARV